MIPIALAASPNRPPPPHLPAACPPSHGASVPCPPPRPLCDPPGRSSGTRRPRPRLLRKVAHPRPRLQSAWEHRARRRRRFPRPTRRAEGAAGAGAGAASGTGRWRCDLKLIRGAVVQRRRPANHCPGRRISFRWMMGSSSLVAT